MTRTLDHLLGDVADQASREGYDEGYLDGYEACRSAVLAVLADGIDLAGYVDHDEDEDALDPIIARVRAMQPPEDSP